MPEDTEDTNAPEPDPEPEPPSVIDVAAAERAAYERQARLREVYAAAEEESATGSARTSPVPRQPTEPEPTIAQPPLYSTVATGRPGRPDGGGPPLPPALGGHAPHAAPDAHPTPSDPPTYVEGEPTTRLLCAAMHLQASFAGHVGDTLLNGSMQAVAPPWGVDPVALVRHARVSTRLWAERDRVLRWVIPSQIAVFLFLLISIMTGRMSWKLELFLAVAAPLAAWLFAWNLIYNHYKGARARALGVMDSRLPAREWAALDRSGPVLSPEEEARLETLARANVITSSGSWPFVGDGQRVSSWTLTVDLEKAPRGPDGGPHAGPDPVTPLDLHRHLLDSMPRTGPSSLHAQHRLYVRGPAAPTIPGLMPSPPGPSPQPGARLPLETIEGFVEKPTPAARGYVALQRVLWGGQIIPSLLVRAERQRNSLFIEASEHVIPPLRGTFHDVTLLPKDTARVRRDLIFASFHATKRQVVRSWGRWFEDRRAGKADAEKDEQTRADFAHGMPMNHGVGNSLREEVGDVGRLNYFGVAEETQAVLSLRKRTFESILEYLVSRNVDITDVKRQVDVIMLSVPFALVDGNATSATLGSNVSAKTGS